MEDRRTRRRLTLATLILLSVPFWVTGLIALTVAK